MAFTRRLLPLVLGSALAVVAALTAVVASDAHAQTAIEPFLLVVFDTSGSMDATIGPAGTLNSCGVRSRRLADARCVMRDVVNGYGDVRFGLMRFQQTFAAGSCTGPCIQGDGYNNPPVCGGCDVTAFGCSGTSTDGELLVPIIADNQATLLNWFDYGCSGACSATTGSGVELVAGGGTPIAGSLRGARAYLEGASSPLIGDAAGTCRPVNVILLTDGMDSCPGTPSTAATELRTTVVGGRTYDVRTYPIGFGITAPDTEIEAIATAGGVDSGATGGTRGFYASDETTLALAFSEIIEDSYRFEVCNGVDDDCDTRIDEGFMRWCNRPGGVTMATLCTDPGETVCNGTDDNCNGMIDEGFTLYCNRPMGITMPTLCANPGEICNGIDDNCAGGIDEGGVCGTCVPGPELCDNLDNDCDTRIDEGLTRSCGTDVGECSTGTQTCVAGSWGVTCPGSVGPVAETCNNRDDDCNGVIDGITRPCGSDVGACQAGTETCTAGMFGACSGAIGPAAETCNNVDDDCDTRVDEMNPGGGGACGSMIGECRPGTLTCMGGGLVCTGGVSPTAESCNTRDDDCDGTTDESVPSTGPCGSMVGECRQGMNQCVSGSFMCIGARGPTTEVCNGRDDDCDGTNDDGNPGGGPACGSSTGVCRPGVLACTMGTLTCTGGVSPTAEVCDSEDDDCDGVTDEAVPTMGACGTATGECDPGVRTCVAGAFTCVGARGPVSEICNTLDDDCDTRTDEGNPGGGVSCGTDVGVCAPGLSQCVGGVLDCVGDTTGSPETCDAEDDDCDGLVDEGNPGGGGTCGMTAEGECDLGALACTGGMLVCRGETGPVAERCDGLDNDCDAMVDEMNPEGGVPCGISEGECEPGTTLCMAGMLICDGGTGPTSEVCNGLDDDCDGVEDEGIPVGAPCGSDVGECSPGVNICRMGALECEGEIGPVDEICDGLDQDCDTMVDEGLPTGVACGTDEGVCTAGTIQCIGGAEVCVGEMVGGPEVCDCDDNDCDGSTDEPPPTGTLCPMGTACISCSCSRECIPSEFGPQCPTGTVPEDTMGTCYCVRPRCEAATCAGQTVTDAGGAVVCAPDGGDGIGACQCRNNECTFPCDGVVCSAPLVCNPESGECVADDCTGLGCPTGEICDIATRTCTVDRCATVTCADDEACRDGTCEDSCATTSCGAGERCEHGACVTDACDGVTCAATEVCNPADGTCVDDGCDGVTCGSGEVCDPVSGDCEQDPCTLLRCPDMQMCEDGECVPAITPMPDGGMMMGGMDGGGPRVDSGPPPDPADENTRVIAAGGGGCLCAVPGRSGPGSGPGSSAAAWMVVALLGLALVARRAR